MAALAGVINTLEATAADPTAGSTALLTSFAAAIIGGTVLTGGRGSVLGTLIGAGALGILIVGLTLYGIQAEIQSIFIGAVLFIAVITDRGASAQSLGAFAPRSRAAGPRPMAEIGSPTASGFRQ